MQSVMTLKDSADIKDFQSVVDSFRTGFAKGPTIWTVNSSNDREVFLFAGWDSIEVSLVFAQRLPQD